MDVSLSEESLVLYDDGYEDQLVISSVTVTNSTDVHLGNKTYYQGPVTIKQFILADVEEEEEVSKEELEGDVFGGGVQPEGPSSSHQGDNESSGAVSVRENEGKV